VSKPATFRHILVVDDDEGVLLLLGDTLRMEGYQVVCARSGAAMKSELERHVPDLVILDLKLKDANAESLLPALKRDGGMVPFIVVTGQGDEKVAVNMMRQGALDYVAKDTSLLELLPTVVARALAAVARERALRIEQAERARLEQKVIAISEEEQRRIGEDLHDDLGQRLTAIEMLCSGLKADVATADARLTPQVDRICRMLREAIAHVRLLSHGLMPVGKGPEALWMSLTELAEHMSTSRRSCRFVSSAVALTLEPVTAGHLYRIAQEAVNNAIKHSGATAITISLETVPDGVELVVADNGEGISSRPTTGAGLQVMRHRASVIHAELTVEAGPKGGTTVRCRLKEKPPSSAAR
jgi:signal transduction histidine kinase